MASLAAKERKRLIKQATPLMKQWLKQQSSSDAIVVTYGTTEVLAWPLPLLECNDKPIYLSEKCDLYITTFVTRRRLFSNEIKSAKNELIKRRLVDVDTSFDTIEKIIVVLTQILQTS